MPFVNGFDGIIKMVSEGGVEPPRPKSADFRTTIVFTTALAFVVWTFSRPSA